MTSTIVKITERAQAIVALSAELDAISARIDAECQRHAEAIAAEDRAHANRMTPLIEQRGALELAITRLGGAVC